MPGTLPVVLSREIIPGQLVSLWLRDTLALRKSVVGTIARTNPPGLDNVVPVVGGGAGRAGGTEESQGVGVPAHRGRLGAASPPQPH